MRHVALCFVCLIAAMTPAIAQDNKPAAVLAPQPKEIAMAQLQDISRLDGQLIQINSVVVRHSDTAQVFTFGEPKGLEVHVLIPNPAIDAARIGDAVAVSGRVRKFDPKAFETDYRWFRQADYADVHSGDWVIIATSVRTQEGTELVPGNTISNAAPVGAKKH